MQAECKRNALQLIPSIHAFLTNLLSFDNVRMRYQRLERYIWWLAHTFLDMWSHHHILDDTLRSFTLHVIEIFVSPKNFLFVWIYDNFCTWSTKKFFLYGETPLLCSRLHLFWYHWGSSSSWYGHVGLRGLLYPLSSSLRTGIFSVISIKDRRFWFSIGSLVSFQRRNSSMKWEI